MKKSAILISGWASPGALLHDIAVELEATGHRVTVLSLPGFGQHESELLNWEQLEKWASNFIPKEGELTIAGWSMGGNLATMLAALHPKKINKLTTLASNPCFTQRDNWKSAMREKKFLYFQNTVEFNIQRGLKRFAELCSAGAEDEKAQQDKINKSLAQQPFYAAAMLVWLKWLKETDFRSHLRRVQCPVTHVLAEQDVLVPVSLKEALLNDYSWHCVEVMNGSHAFFLDYPKEIARLIAL